MKRSACLLAVVGWAIVGYSAAQGQEYDLLEESEEEAMAETFQYALENNKTNEASAWVNPDAGRSGTLVPIQTFQTAAGQYCREYVTTILIGGEEQQGYGTACRQPDGMWLIASGESRAEYRPVDSVHPFGYADWYSRYPYYAWNDYYPRIFFSFDIIHFSGHRHLPRQHFHRRTFSHGRSLFTGPGHFHDRRHHVEGTRHRDRILHSHVDRDSHVDHYRRSGSSFAGDRFIWSERHSRGGRGFDGAPHLRGEQGHGGRRHGGIVHRSGSGGRR